MTAFLKPWQRALITVGRLKTLVIDALTTELAKYGLYAHGGAAAPDSVGVVLWNHDADRPSLYCVASATNAAVDIDGTSGNAESRMIDGNGRVAAPGALGTFQVLASSAVDYELGCMVVDVPSSVTKNLNVPGTYNYDQVTSQVGYTAAAGTVTNPSGTQIKIIIDNLLDGTEGDCSALSDTTVRVMLKAVEDGGGVGPQANSGWFEDLAIQWDGSNNYVQTTTYLGQSTPSTTSADYAIYALGPICRRVSTGLPSGAARFAVYTGGGTGAVVTDVAGYEDEATSSVFTIGRRGSEDHFRLSTHLGIDGNSGYPVPAAVWKATGSGTNTVGTTEVVIDEFTLPAGTIAQGLFEMLEVMGNIFFTSGSANVLTVRVRFGLSATALASREIMFEMVVSAPQTGDSIVFDAHAVNVLTAGDGRTAGKGICADGTVAAYTSGASLATFDPTVANVVSITGVLDTGAPADLAVATGQARVWK